MTRIFSSISIPPYCFYLRNKVTIIAEIYNFNKQSEEALKKSQEELIEQKQCFEETNIAMKVLLKQREEDKLDLEKKVLNVSETTINFHRKNLRVNFGLTNQRTNLRSYLLSISYLSEKNSIRRHLLGVNSYWNWLAI
jgi:hypothetical protein